MIQVLILLLLQQAEKVSAAWSVTFENPDICALRGSSVEIRCSYSYPDEESVRGTAWDRGMNQNGVWERVRLSGLPSYNGRFEYQGDHAHNCSLVLRDLQENDTGYYYFWFDTDKFGRRSKTSVFLSVTGLRATVRPDRVRLGDSVTLDCQTECQNGKIIWFRDGRPVAEPTFQAQTTDTGNYSCAFEGLKSSQSDPVALDVWYPPLNVSVEVNRSDPLLVGSSVTLTCRGSASPAAITYTWWYSSDVSNSSTELQVGSGQVLSISSVELAHTGTYICQAQNRAGQSRSAELLLAVEETVHPLIVLGIGIKVIILLVLPPILIWVWKCRSRPHATNEENTSNDYENGIFG
ncbi:carcinoembryonic antigen-related cell adhesion molecule 6-like isoform X1 [Xiphophorus maculatus]|uniref:Carcinoembryonic antigen-related cell adhesion molecule 6-like n=1 Tax=Xiphophorus maculatus TaxID=8083 RepID=M4A366_XIPMA|nr:carcinoembryonic antigen-related cell adhesion molecule 6-like isoform X1 [Xiphophorus maculatus]XP_023186055.1 carcinoembryonic antigen-related cell adhesion molecule 6-like isoform X1 [Xiphophorus maculatus]